MSRRWIETSVDGLLSAHRSTGGGIAYCAPIAAASISSAAPWHRGRASRWLAAAMLLLAATAAALFTAAPARAAAEASDPQGFVERLGGEVVGILKAPDVKPSDRQRRFQTLFVQTFDAPTIGRFVLGQYWQRTSEDQRRSYLELFSDYVAAIYAVQFSHYEGQTFKTTGIQPVADGDSAVEAEIERSGKPPIKVTFRVRREGDALKIVDVMVEGVSLIVTKRDEFASVLGREGLDGLMKRMHATLDGMPKGSA